MADLFWYDGNWSSEQPKIAGPMDLGLWSASSVFDGARAIKGALPDIEQHCERVINSARSMLMEPTLTAEQICGLCVEGVSRLPDDTDYYIRPLFTATTGLLMPEPGGVEFTLAIFEAPLPPENGGSACLSSFRRSAPDQAPTDAKAGCLYPNSQRAKKEAIDKGFDVAVMLDPDGNVAEYAHANFWMTKDGVAITPTPNGTFLNGITKQRVTQLLRDHGIDVVERAVHPDELDDADEIWVTGNYGKVQAMTRWEQRHLQPGPVFRKARELYMDFVATCKPS